MTFKRISVETAKQLMSEKEFVVADVRDQASYEAGHIENAILLNDANITDFIQAAELDRPLFIYCYHGNSSQGAANYCTEQGFTEVYSIDGGYSAWSYSAD